MAAEPDPNPENETFRAMPVPARRHPNQGPPRLLREGVPAFAAACRAGGVLALKVAVLLLCVSGNGVDVIPSAAAQALPSASAAAAVPSSSGTVPLQAPPPTTAPLQNQMLMQPVELATLQVERADGALNLEFAVRINLPRAVDEALHRGVPLYFVAEAQLFRNRWYWRDERMARIARSWRVAYQPLTNTWRVGLGGLNQTHATLADSLAAVSRSSGWRLADLSQLDPDKSYYVDFRYRLDTSQLPGPMQFGLGSQADWAVEASRVLKVDL